MAMMLVEFSLQSIMGKLEKMVQEEAALLAGVEDDARFIVDELRSINSFLTAMSTRRNLDAQLQNWVQDVREMAYDAEDSIDEFVCRLRSTPYDERGVRGFFKNFHGSLKSLKARHDIASEFKKLKVQVEEIRKRHDRYSHPNESFTSFGTTTRISDLADSYSDPRIISLFAEEAQLVGINQSKDQLIRWVMDENHPERTVISLVGFGGLGKTTLAKAVYDDPIIAGGHFQSRAWIAVSQNYSIRELLKKIILQISVEEQQDAILKKVQLLNQMDESQLVKTVKTFSMERELKNVSREILQKCNGLPLVIVTIGGLLASRPDKTLEEWKEFRNHLGLEIQTNDMLSKIHQILALSYNDLPYHLKPCFLFLGIFPEDYAPLRKSPSAASTSW